MTDALVKPETPRRLCLRASSHCRYTPCTLPRGAPCREVRAVDSRLRHAPATPASETAKPGPAPSPGTPKPLTEKGRPARPQCRALHANAAGRLAPATKQPRPPAGAPHRVHHTDGLKTPSLKRVPVWGPQQGPQSQAPGTARQTVRPGLGTAAGRLKCLLGGRWAAGADATLLPVCRVCHTRHTGGQVRRAGSPFPAWRQRPSHAAVCPGSLTAGHGRALRRCLAEARPC